MKLTKSQLVDIIKEELDKKKFYSDPGFELTPTGAGSTHVKVTPQEYLGYEDPRAQVSVFEPGLDLPDLPDPNMVSLDVEALTNAYFPGQPYPKEYKRGIEVTEQEAEALQRHFQERTSGRQATQDTQNWRILPAGGVDEEGIPHSYPIQDWPINEELEYSNRGPFGDVFDKLNNMYYSIKDTSGEPGGKSVLEQQEGWESLLIKAFKNMINAWQEERQDPDAWWRKLRK
jgi:hypothetical protein